MKKLVATLIGAALVVVATDCTSPPSHGRAQTCGADSDCAGAACELGRCRQRAHESVKATPLDVNESSPWLHRGASPFSLGSMPPSEVFQHELRERIVAAPRLTPAGEVLVVTESGRVVRLDARGELVAEHALGRRVVASPVVDLAGRVFVGSMDGHLTVLDASLSVVGETELGDAIVGPLGMLPNGLVAVPTRGVALVTAAGVELRRITSPTVLRGGVAWHDLGFVVFGTPEGLLVGARIDGTSVFRTDLGASIDGAPSIAADGTIYVGTDLGHVVHVSADGTVLRRFAAALDVRVAPAFGADGTIVAFSLDGVVHGLDPSLARERFSTPLTGALRAAPLVDHDGRIYVGTTQDRVHVLARDGHELATLVTGADVTTTPLLTPDGMLVVAADDGIVRGYR